MLITLNIQTFSSQQNEFSFIIYQPKRSIFVSNTFAKKYNLLSDLFLILTKYLVNKMHKMYFFKCKNVI